MTWISWTNVALGVWLTIAAFAFNHPTGTGVTENLVSGLFVALAALWAARAYRPGISMVASWTVMLTGVWVVAAPFALGYERSDLAVANELIVGLAIVALGIANTLSRRRQIQS